MLCMNCFRLGHFSKFCRSSCCRKCGSKHHTLLHTEQTKNESKNDTNSKAEVEKGLNCTLSSSNQYIKQVLLSTSFKSNAVDNIDTALSNLLKFHKYKKIPKNIKLTDPTFFKPVKIDLLNVDLLYYMF